jgi:hypothetical protein
LIAARVVFKVMSFDSPEMKEAEQAGKALGDSGWGKVEKAAGEVEKFLPGDGWPDSRIVGDVTDERFGFDGVLGDVKAVDGDSAGGRTEKAGNEFDDSSFTGAVGADEGENFTGLNGKTHLIDSFGSPEVFGKVGHLKHELTLAKDGRIGYRKKKA